VKRLIVNADDFGLTPGVNAAILELSRAGVISSATIMAAAKHFLPAAQSTTSNNLLAIGCHVVLTDGIPVLPAEQIPSLIDPKAPSLGRFRPTLSGFLRDLASGRIKEPEIEREASAQIQRIRDYGLRVSHVDTHKHAHIFPRVLRPLVRAAQAHKIAAIRNPFEPRWSVRATRNAGAMRRVAVRGFRIFQASFDRVTRQAGMVTPSGTIGLLATGRLNVESLRAILASMPDGIWELVCHPGYQDSELNQVQTRLRAEREIERSALLEVIPEARRQDPRLVLENYSQLVETDSRFEWKPGSIFK
jgi:predicted glycoside hydrolase/deacetylase ChbG (UPF0249 family)